VFKKNCYLKTSTGIFKSTTGTAYTIFKQKNQSKRTFNSNKNEKKNISGAFSTFGFNPNVSAI